MSLVSTPGLLLRAYDYSESSRILRFLTPDLGIVSVIAKGVRRRSARGEEPIPIFGEGTLTFAHRDSRDLHTLRDYQPLAPARPLRGYRRLAAASLIAELLLVHSLQEGDPTLYRWVRDSFEEMGRTGEETLAGALLGGAWRTLALLGFPPELERCVRCGSPLEEVEAASGGGGEASSFYRLDIPAGGLVCPDCAADAAMPRVGREGREALRELVRGKAPFPLRGVRAHLSILHGFALHHLAPSRDLRTFEAARALLGDAEQDGWVDE